MTSRSTPSPALAEVQRLDRLFAALRRGATPAPEDWRPADAAWRAYRSRPTTGGDFLHQLGVSPCEHEQPWWVEEKMTRRASLARTIVGTRWPNASPTRQAKNLARAVARRAAAKSPAADADLDELTALGGEVGWRTYFDIIRS